MKRPFLLLECLIALSLLSIIIAFLLSFFCDLTWSKTTLQKEREQILCRKKMELRLGQILSHLTTAENCEVSYDNGIDCEPLFCGVLKGSLHCDEQKRLLFVSTSSKGDTRKEILYENVHCCELQFFNRKTGVWENRYPESQPFMAKLILNQTVVIPFFL
jgi:type II secretory pathway component PulJ